jgi:hypothetical protein
MAEDERLCKICGEPIEIIRTAHAKVCLKCSKIKKTGTTALKNDIAEEPVSREIINKVIIYVEKVRAEIATLKTIVISNQNEMSSIKSWIANRPIWKEANLDNLTEGGLDLEEEEVNDKIEDN